MLVDPHRNQHLHINYSNAVCTKKNPQKTSEELDLAANTILETYASSSIADSATSTQNSLSSRRTHSYSRMVIPFGRSAKRFKRSSSDTRINATCSLAPFQPRDNFTDMNGINNHCDVRRASSSSSSSSSSSAAAVAALSSPIFSVEQPSDLSFDRLSDSSTFSEPKPSSIRCLSCNRWICELCHLGHGRTTTCDAHSALLGILDSQIEGCKPCPNCTVPIFKDGGCNHMHCTRCGYEFCWIHLIKWEVGGACQQDHCKSIL